MHKNFDCWMSDELHLDLICGVGHNPCLNGGTCRRSSPDTGTQAVCLCPNSWAGTHCQSLRCGSAHSLVSGAYGLVQSPGWPGNYPPLADCSFDFLVNPGYVLKLYFGFFRLRPAINGTCADYVAVYDNFLSRSLLMK